MRYYLNSDNFHGFGNQQPSSLNDIRVGEKVQRLAIEESTNKIATSLRHIERCDDIVCSAMKVAEAVDKHCRLLSIDMLNITVEGQSHVDAMVLCARHESLDARWWCKKYRRY
jgi:hypothetical protein